MEPSLEAALELSKLKNLPAKKRLLQQQQNELLLNSSTATTAPPSSISIPINQAHSTSSNSISSINNNNNNDNNKSSMKDEPMEEDDEDEEINVHDDDSPLDMRITKHDSDSDSVRPSVIRRAPSFNSPSDPSSTCDPFIDEHFRRSLGTDYDLILRNKQLEREKQRMLEEQQMIQQQQAAAAAVAQQQNLLKLKHHKKHQIHQHHQAMLNIQQQENQLPIQATTIPIQVPIVNPQLPPQQVPQKQVIITEHSDANESMSVDDHFAKALGETWTKIQNESGK